MPPELETIDHVHVFVRDRAAATIWYAQVLGLRPDPALSHWAAGGGPLTLANTSGSLHLALFEAAPQPCRSTIALRVDAAGFRAWQQSLTAALPQPPRREDHGAALSLYFQDPDGNPYEITTYEVDAVRAAGV